MVRYPDRFHKTKSARWLASLLLVGLIAVGLDKIGGLVWLRRLTEQMIVVPIKQLKHDRSLAKKLGQISADDNCPDLDPVLLKVGELTEENQRLNQLLNTSGYSDWEYLKVKVLEVGGSGLVLAGGSDDGVVLGRPVVLPEAGLIYLGRVVEATPKQSRVELPSAYNNRLSVVMFSADRPGVITGRGLAVGQGAGNIKIEQIVNQETVRGGDLVGYPYQGKTLLVGKVSEVVSSAGGVFKEAIVLPASDTLDMLTVFVVK